MSAGNQRKPISSASDGSAGDPGLELQRRLHPAADDGYLTAIALALVFRRLLSPHPLLAMNGRRSFAIVTLGRPPGPTLLACAGDLPSLQPHTADLSITSVANVR